ncbi:uncharacterized protein LOC129589804 [Paramacrobiotus metropolitanus]|uniref:uncharacterized protein LOC129589804 n=1 Tax=Paramacrobiotus metropolitanus TaxID=2943436 RepID=UPI0024462991|nr:uncharacterized protein LOC129589804 [Paramacrobiotus metropolitanus]
MVAITFEPEVYGKTCRYLYDIHDPGQLIGQGSFGYVCKATITDYGNYTGDGDVAVKVVQPRKDTYADESARNRMRSRFQRLLGISHDHITEYHQFMIDFTTSGDTFFVYVLMDYYNKGNMAHRLQRFCHQNQMWNTANGTRLVQMPFDLKTAVDYMFQISEGLGFLHSNGIIHGNLNPCNIFVRTIEDDANSHEVLVIGGLEDFVQKKNNLIATADLDANYPQGSFRYMSPEMLGCSTAGIFNAKICRKTDIWSLGCIMLDMINCVMGTDHVWLCNGELAHDRKRGDNVEERHYAVMVAAGYMPEVPFAAPFPLGECARRCLCYDSKARISVVAVMEMLRKNTEVRPQTLGLTTPSPPCSLRQKAKRVIAMVLLFLVVCVLILKFLFGTGRSSGPW